MAITDWILLGALGLGFYRGFKTGLVMQLVLIAGVIVAVYTSTEISLWLAEKLNVSFSRNNVLALRLSIFLVWLLIYLLAWLIGKTLSKALQFLLLGTINRILGGLLGMLQAALIACALITLIVSTHSFNRTTFSGPIAKRFKQAGDLIFSGIKQIEEASVIMNENVDLPR